MCGFGGEERVLTVALCTLGTQEREKRTSEEAARKKAEEDAAAHSLSLGAEGEKRKALEEKLALEMEARVELKLQAG
jgi:hypothetical protein